MLQGLHDVIAVLGGTLKNHYRWLRLDSNKLTEIFPFWEIDDLQRISTSLVEKGVLLINSPPLSQSHFLHFAINEKIADSTSTTHSNATSTIGSVATNTATAAPQHEKIVRHRVRSGGATLLPDDWQPPEDLLQLLALNHNIPRDFALQQLEDFNLYWRERAQVSHSWPSKFRQHVLNEWRHHQSREAANTKAQQQQNDLGNNWQPSRDALDILFKAEINPEFIEDAIPEFVLYWRERGEVSSTWNSKFIAHIRRQWAKYTASLEHDYEPRAIPANWQPNEDVFDILRLANIDISFARQQVPEFVLFWRDTKQIHRSWNTKFLQHVKYQWATRHKMEQHDARQSNDHQPGQAKDGSLIKRLTDRSWAKGIVEGL